MRIPFISAIAAGALALGGCAYGDLGVGYGSGYGGYYGGGYSNYGYGSPYYGAGYGGYGYSSPYYGWYDNYYYPGTGYYVYDSYRRPHTWTQTQRNYWTSRQPVTTRSTTTRTVRPNWSSFDRAAARTERQQTRQERRQQRQR